MAEPPARLIACKIAFARRALRRASSDADCLSALAAMVDVGCDMRADDLGGTGPERARRLLDEAVAYLLAAAAAFPAGGDEHCVALYLLARACLGRGSAGPVPDADNAIICLRRLLTALPAGDPDRTEVESLFAGALLDRAVGATANAADLDEALPLMTSVLDAVPPEHPFRRAAFAAVAVAYMGRYIGFEGAESDRDAAETYAAAALAATGEGGEPDDSSASAHIVLAWTTLTRQFTAEQRSVMLRQAEVEAARSGAHTEVTTRLLAAYGAPQISVADAQTAIGHLRQIPPDVGDVFIRSTVPVLWGFAQLALTQAGAEVTDVGEVAERLDAVAADPQTANAERAELLGMRAALLAGQSDAAAVDALGDAISGLPPGHLMRTPILGMLSSMLGQEVEQAQSADDLIARLDEVTAVLDRLPHDDPEAAHALVLLGARIMNASSSSRSVFQQDRLFGHIERLAADLAPADPLAPLTGFMVWAGRHMRARLASDTERADAALREMTGLAGMVPPGHVARPFVLSSVAAAYMQRPVITGELRNLDLAERFANDAVTEAEAVPAGMYAKGTSLHGYLMFIRGHLGAMKSVYNPSLAGVQGAIDDLEQAEAEFGPSESERMGLMVSLGTARVLLEQLSQPIGPGAPVGPAINDVIDRELAAAGRAGRDSIDYPVLAGRAAAGLMMRGIAARDVTLIDRAVELYADICTVPSLGLGERPRALEEHGEALRIRYTMTRDPRDLGNAIARLEEARRAAQQEPGSPLIGGVLQSLASAYRTRGNQALGDVERAVRIGLDGLRESAGDVLLQDNDDNALQMARRVTNDAAEMARWFLSRNRDEAAISAIELGRGMVLHAATSGTGVVAALSAAGQRELAAEWSAQPAWSPPDASAPDASAPDASGLPPQDSDLRYRAMLALEGTPAEARLLSPPTVADIAAALDRSGAEALVYLLPHDDAGPGIAVIVDRAATVSWLLLIRLRTGAGSAVAEFLRARRAVEQADAPDDPACRADWLLALDAVCDWAWQAAIGPLLRTLAARAKRADANPAERDGQPPRIVLVSAGELGLVPWHAARRPAGDSPASEGSGARHDYACRDAVFSYASSARQFIDATRQGGRPWGQAPVLISDAGDSLYYAMVEVAHLHAAHYANGAIFGSARHLLADLADPTDPTALAVAGRTEVRPADVLDALPHGENPGASVLHFGCHGRVSVPVLGSSLRLGMSPRGESVTAAATPGAAVPGVEISVSVADILRQARTARPRSGGARPGGGGLVVLAACVTDVADADYDEALTLATAFLATGTAGVVATRWSVPEVGTALFMAAFHRFLNEPGGDPARALRAAQLWMLDPDREVPETWRSELHDEAGLDGQPDGHDLASIETWAGFTYQGR